jgi:hypothetical protein
MRRVHIQGTPPADWVAKADAVTDQLRAAPDAQARKAIIEANGTLWRDERIRDWLRRQFHDKCWFSEARESVSAIHVDHFRPKGRIKDHQRCVVAEEGYWWLAFDWRNYRICGQLINTKKGDLFPICEGARCRPGDAPSLYLEAPMLIDPLTDQARLISFQSDEDGCMAISAPGNDDAERERAEQTIAMLGLNRLDVLNRNRKRVWDECASHIKQYRAAQQTMGAQALALVEKTKAKQSLQGLTQYAAEFSSVAAACIEKEAPQALRQMIYGG